MNREKDRSRDRHKNALQKDRSWHRHNNGQTKRQQMRRDRHKNKQTERQKMRRDRHKNRQTERQKMRKTSKCTTERQNLGQAYEWTDKATADDTGQR